MKLNIMSKFVCISCLSLTTLFTLSYQQTSNNQTCDDHCCLLNSKTIQIKYFPEKKDFDWAERTCNKYNSVLLTDELYEDMKVCIHEYLKNRNELISAVWLDDPTGIVPVFNLTAKFKKNKDYGSYNYICIRQEVLKTFNLTIVGNSPSKKREFDLLTPPWNTEEVFTEVSRGQNVTLTCEAVGISHPTMIFKKNGIEMTNIKTYGTSLFVEISADECGHLGTFTCESYSRYSSLKRSVQISVQCSTHLCPGEDTLQNITATICTSLSFSFCVITYADISNYLTFNNSDVLIGTDNNNYNWNRQENNNFDSYNIIITIKNTTNITSGELTIGVCTSQGREYRFNYRVLLNILQEQCQEDSQDLDSVNLAPVTSRREDVSVVITVALPATGVIILTIACIVFIVTVIYRKRGYPATVNVDNMYVNLKVIQEDEHAYELME